MKNSIDNGRRRFVLAALTSSAAAALTNVSPLWAAPVGRHFKDQVLTGDIKNLNVSKSLIKSSLSNISGFSHLSAPTTKHNTRRTPYTSTLSANGPDHVTH